MGTIPFNSDEDPDNHRLAVSDLLVKVRNSWSEIQIFAQALSCQAIQGEDFADQATSHPPPPERRFQMQSPLITI